MSLINGVLLQNNCNKEGFNVGSYRKSRIGILGNNEDDCETCDSIVGFGIGKSLELSNGNNHFSSYAKTFGYILVQ